MNNNYKVLQSNIIEVVEFPDGTKKVHDKTNDIYADGIETRTCWEGEEIKYLDGKEIIKKELLNSGYYDETHDYIVEVHKIKIIEFLQKLFETKNIKLLGIDDYKLKEENKKLKETIQKMQQDYEKSKNEMMSEIHCTNIEYDKKTSQLIHETNKKIAEIKDEGRTLIKTITKYI